MTNPQSLVRVYKGSQKEATEQFQADAAILSTQGYSVTSQNWIAGSRGCGSFVLAAFLVVVAIGVIMLLYYWMVKPPGSLTVTYELRNPSRTS
jgi:hypothetical protein